MKQLITSILCVIMLLPAVIAPVDAHAICAKVSLVILQQLTIERVAFDAKLAISNGIPDSALQNMRVDVKITDTSGNVKNDIFFVRPPTLTGISGAMDGTGSVSAASSGEAHWLIIPSPGAGGQNAAGTDYLVGATLSYTIGATQETIPINPAKITVKPMPQLVLDYFMPYQVIGDNPFTRQVEPPVAYPLAVRVINDGYGTATKLRIDSAQPKIVENKQGLLIDFKLLGAAVNDGVVTPSLTVNFGDLPSKKGATASWQMISTLSGRFIEFKTSFTHASELGGDLTSLITATTPHYLTHMVKVNLPGRDGRLDFLGYDTNLATNPDKLPQYIYESEIPNGSTILADAKSAVTVVLPSALPALPTPAVPNVTLTLLSGAAGWIYTKLADPSQGMQRLLSVTRSDGVKLDSNNFWIDEGLDANYKKTWTLQFIDYRADANTTGAYTLTFTKPDVDTTPPTTTLIFDGPVVGTAPAYITPQTRIVLTATDNEGGSGVDAMYRKVGGLDNDFIPGLPFNLSTAGDYIVQFYSTDLAGNVETATSTAVKVLAAAPTVSSFTATPASFVPQAPKGVAAARSVDFVVKAASQATTLPVEIAIASGSAFLPENVIRTLKGAAQPATDLHLAWDGKDTSGKIVATGSYTARLKVSDGLDNPLDATAPSHTATQDIAISATEWFKARALDPNPAADQQYPRVSGTKVVWQDLRNGIWDIFVKDSADTSATALKIPGTSAGRERPSIDGNIVVWQDKRNGTWDIYGYNLISNTEISIATDTGDKQRPVVSGNWVAWQDYRNNNWDIFAKNITTNETIQVTSHERDQLHPALYGNTLVWEDYRHGPGEVYAYGLATRSEQQLASGSADLFGPAVSGNVITWADRRNGQADIYSGALTRGATRLTYGAGDHTQPSLNSDLLVYTDFETSPDDPNLSYRVLSSGVGGRLVSEPARQEEPAVGTGTVVWQDTRDGKYQIYTAPLQTESLPVEVALKPGYNLIAVGGRLAAASSTAIAFLTANKDTLAIDRILGYDPLHNTYTEANATGGDFSIVKGMGLTIYTHASGVLTTADAGETATYTLLPGANQIGLLTAPFGYSAYDLMKSLGLDNVRSIRRFDSDSGLWRSVAVRAGQGGNELVGSNFTINSGDGVIITMKNRVDGWTP